jgi:hypothetical protein
LSNWLLIIIWKQLKVCTWTGGVCVHIFLSSKIRGEALRTEPSRLLSPHQTRGIVTDSDSNEAV